MSSSKEIAINITLSFEGGKWDNLSGDFDAQGLSLGALQWCLGQGSLQPLLKKAFNDTSINAHEILGDKYDDLYEVVFHMNKQEQVAWGHSISTPGKLARVVDAWRVPLKALASAMQHIQEAAMEPVMARAVSYCEEFELRSVRALAFFFDICTQNGSIKQEQIDLAKEQFTEDMSEQEKMQIILEERLKKCNPRWMSDVRARKECIINGSGSVHGKNRDLDAEFGLSDEDYK